MNVQKAVIVVHGLANDSANNCTDAVETIPYQLKLNTKIGRYPTMPFMVMHFKERNLQRSIWNCVKPLIIDPF